MPFWPLCCVSEAILFKRFRPGHRAGVFIWQNFRPGCRDLGNRASPAAQMNTSIFLQRREWRDEISEIALIGLIRTGPDLYIPSPNFDLKLNANQALKLNCTITIEGNLRYV